MTDATHATSHESSGREPVQAGQPAPTVRGLLTTTVHTLTRGGWRLATVFLLSQLAVFFVVLPIIRWLFREALSAAGMHGLDLSEIRWQAGTPLSLGILLLILLLGMWVASLQLTLLVVAVRRVRAGLSLGVKPLFAEIGRVFRKLFRPSSLSLFWYLFLVLPLASFGFFSLLTQAVQVPSFISGEIVKTVPGLIGYLIFLLLCVEINSRLALTIPIFAFTDATGGRSMRLSIRLTKRSRFRLLGAFLVVVTVLALLGALLTWLTLVPTQVTDALIPGASVPTAAFSLGVAQVAGLFISGFAVVCFASIILEFFAQRQADLPAEFLVRGVHEADAAQGLPRARPTPPRPTAGAATGKLVFGGALITAALVLGFLNIPMLTALDEHPETLVLGHRGFSDGGVENTLSGLDAAAAAGADLVEMDVMQTRDGKFVAMHDAQLTRLADRDDLVKDLTLEELTSITVHDSLGHSDTIPSFADYVRHAQELGMPLLVEIKPHGGETSDVVPRLIAELEELGALDQNIYHSLDKAKIEELKRLRPGLTVGYTMAFAGVQAPDTTADFIVVESFSYTDHLRKDAEAKGLGFMAWTVNDPATQRILLRDGIDGIITDHPDRVLTTREEMQQATGLAPVLRDAIARFVTVG